MSPRPIGYATLAVLQALVDGHRYGFDITDHTGLASGTVYPALSTLSRKGLVTSSWEEDDIAVAEARPRRRYYTVTREGARALEEGLTRFRVLGLGRPEPASGGRG